MKALLSLAQLKYTNATNIQILAPTGEGRDHEFTSN